MIDCTYLYWIDQCLQQIYLSHADEFFDDLNILLVSDFYQLSSVEQMSLYQHLAATDVYETHMSRAVYLTIDQTAVLDWIMRQSDDDSESCAFCLALIELRDQTVSEASWHLLLERCKQNLSADEIRQFDDAIHLYE